MNTDEAINICSSFVEIGLHKWSEFKGLHQEIQATAVLLREYQTQVEINKRLDNEIRRLMRGDVGI